MALAYRIIAKATFSPDTFGRAGTVGPFAVARRRRTKPVEKESMLGFNRWHLLKGLAAILCIGGTVSLALIYFFPAPPSKFAIATGARNQIYQSIGNRYREILARSNVDLEVRITNGPVDNIKLLNDPTSGVEAGIVQGGISDSIQSPELLSLGRINYNVYWIFYSATETLNDLRQLKGRRIALGPQGSLRATTEKILEISGVTAENTTLLGLSAQDAVNAVNDGQADALFFPFALDSAILHSLLINPRVRPMNFTQAEALTRIFPFLVRLVLPQGVIDFERMVPATDMILIAASNVVLVRKDIHPALIDLLVQAIKETHSKIEPRGIGGQDSAAYRNDAGTWSMRQTDRQAHREDRLRSSLRLAATRSHWALSSASTDQVAMRRA
jgi:TRAP-type uncharacterized transport system substrate-binding protein